MSTSTTQKPLTLTTPISRTYVHYDPSNLPPKPSPSWTRFVCISDTHEAMFAVPEGDVLLHSGDLTHTGILTGFAATFEWLFNLPHPVKIVIAGNHDLPLHESWYKENHHRFHAAKFRQNLKEARDLITGPRAEEAGLVYLEDTSHQFQVREGGKTWSVYGSPWQPEFYNWAFNYDRGRQADEIVNTFPKAEILLTHGPPYGMLDMTNRDVAAGCESLARRLHELQPRLHVFGHIHEARGANVGAWPGNPMEQVGEKLDGKDVTGTVTSGSPDAVLTNIPNWPPVPWSPLTHDEKTNQTVFVNASNEGAGSFQQRYWGTGDRQPIVVDLLED